MSTVQKLINQMKKDGKIEKIDKKDLAEMRRRINEDMERSRIENNWKQRKSWLEAAKIIISF